MKSIALTTLIIVFLATAVAAQSDVNTTVIQGAFQDFSANAGGRTFTGVDFHPPVSTVGSPYLFDKWVKGSVVNSNDSVVANPGLVFNYNKMTGALLVTQDRQTYIELDRGSYKAFTLIEPSGIVHNFEWVPAVNQNMFVEAISKGGKYALYKLTKTSFKKADFHTDGLVETGDRDNQYIDEFEYYVLNPKNKTPQPVKLNLRKKAIKEVFGADAVKLEAYFSQHRDDDLNEDFIKGLVEFLNQ